MMPDSAFADVPTALSGSLIEVNRENFLTTRLHR